MNECHLAFDHGFNSCQLLLWQNVNSILGSYLFLIILVDYDKAIIVVPLLAWFYSSSGYASDGTTLQEYHQSLGCEARRC